MSVAHLGFNHGTPHGSLLHAAMHQLEDGLNGLNEIIATIQQMIDGDGSQAAHFTYVADKFGFTDTATAKAAWEEANSLKFKLNTNSSVSDVNAAMLQAFNKFR